MNDRMTVAVYGASGHTGRFVVAELERRGAASARSASGATPHGSRKAATTGRRGASLRSTMRMRSPPHCAARTR